MHLKFSLLSSLFIIGLKCVVNGSKLDYDINEEYQNLEGSYQGFIPSPVYPIPPASYVIGGNFGVFTNEKINVVGIQQAIALQCSTSLVNEKFISDLETIFFSNIFNNNNTKTGVTYAGFELLRLGVGATVSASDFGNVYVSVNPSISFVESSVLGKGDITEDIRFPSSLTISSPSMEEMYAVVSTLEYFNWTLVVPIFDIGYDNLFNSNYFTKAAADYDLNSTCRTFYWPGMDLEPIAQCIADSQAKVILLWSTMDNVLTIIEYFYNFGSDLENIVFVGGDSWFPFVSFPNFTRGKFPTSYMKGSIGVLPIVADRLELYNCIEKNLKEKTNNFLFVQMWQDMYNCTINEELSENSGIPSCQTDKNYSEFGLTFSTAASIYDAVFSIYTAIWQITYNCSGVNTYLSFDVCELDHMSGFLIDAVMKKNDLDLFKKYKKSDYSQLFEIFQAPGNISLALVGISTFNETKINDSLLVWKNGDIPISAIVPYEPSLTEDAGILALVLLIIGWIVNAFLIIYFYINRKERVIKRTSHIFTQLMLFGVLSCLISQLFWSINQSVTICILKIWFMAIGFGLIMGNLLAKTYRIYLIFNNKTLKSVVIEDKLLMYFSLSVLVLEILFLSIYTFTGGLPSPVVYYDQFDNLNAYVQCSVESDFVQLWGIITILLLNGILIICGGVVAFITRKIDSSYNESKHITSVTFLYILSCALAIPLYYTSPASLNGCKTQFLIRTIAIMMCLLGTLFILFLPIVISLEREKMSRKNNSTNSTTDLSEPMSYRSESSETLTDNSNHEDNVSFTTDTNGDGDSDESELFSDSESESYMNRAIRKRKSSF